MVAGPRDDAFTLVTLMILVAVLNIMVAVALPLWTQQIQREKEEELIFRGLQYAEAIRIFQTRVGRYPIRLEELIEIEPRSIRQLWKDPMTDDGKWGLVMAQGQPQQGGDNTVGGRNLAGQGFVSGSAPGQTGGRDEDDDDEEGSGSRFRRRRNRDRDRDDDTVTTGPISGVHSRSEEDSVKLFMGAAQYSAWVFTADVLPIAPTAPGEIVPSLSSKWVGRPFPEGIEPVGGTGIEDSFDEDEPEGRDSGNRRNRRDRRGKKRGDGG